MSDWNGFGFWVIQFAILFKFIASHNANEAPDFFTAAVYEHAKKGDVANDQPREYVAKNLIFYENAAKEAKAQLADIIVFPEYGIIPWLSREDIKKYLEIIPDPKRVQSNPCNYPDEFYDRPVLYNLSCIAKRYNIVLVANMGDIQPCSNESDPNCPEDGTFHFNANVVFDKDGTILAKYHKERLFMEPGMNFPQEPQNPIFRTEFGTFAMFVCFDANYKNITNAAHNIEVDAILLPNMWFDFKPFLSSVQFWEAWSVGNNVPFLPANGQLSYDAVVGSGIFLGRHATSVYTYNPDGLSKLLVSKVPKRNKSFTDYLDSTITVITENGSQSYDVNNDGKEFPESCTRKLSHPLNNSGQRYHCSEENTDGYSLIKLTETTGFLEACNNGMCCTLNYSADTMDEDFYLGVYNGTTNAEPYAWCTENCFVARCDSFNNSVCKTFPMRSNTVFRNLKLKANFTTEHVYPSMMRNNGRLVPLYEKTYEIKVYGDHVEAYIQYESDQIAYERDHEIPLIFAGFNGRCFKRDPPYPVNKI